MRMRHHKRWLAVAAVLSVISVGWILLTTEWPSLGFPLGEVEAWLRGWGAAAYLVFVLAFMVLALFPLPSTFWILLGGALFGPFTGGALSLLAATLAAIIAFMLARTWLQPWLVPRMGARSHRLRADVEAEGWRVVALTRLVPVFPFAPTNYALGLVRLPLPVFALTTVLALMPSLFAYAWLGHATREMAAGADSGVQLGLAVLAVLALLLLLPRLVRRIWLGQKTLHAEAPLTSVSPSDPGEQDPETQGEEQQGGERA
ncbi:MULTISPECIES: TVP38/TMEM64 family protein [unclassified Thioalkalivibrio]|uniref:TVP38/TMEM64 family protein n=1 Tax=unclassified Thioalkalivibrio TaxID=2621013 RepID=UPI0004760C06|nr:MULTISPECIES: TVP38/TMEM64 family protein [unclassified Thioalkalivibrio]